MKIAVSGKGGVGKTLIAGTLACKFAAEGLKVVAIDADPSPNLALTLGLIPENARKLVPISDNRELVELKTGTGVSGVYRLTFAVEDIVRDYSVPTPCGVNLIVMGTIKSMGAGCTCAANAVVRALLHHMIVKRDEVVLVDMEAGVEHLGRGTAKNVDVLLVVTDSSIKSLETARHIHRLAEKADLKHILLIGNKVANKPQREAIEAFAKVNKMNLIHVVPYDEEVVTAEMRGETPLKRRESPAMQSVESLSAKIGKTIP
ncbi:MAG: P-loop NTPase [Candidatus Bathyarchaeota archaeon]|jgi:CO dehydrogenase maturation factor|nr:P-loop NTPase [Candidatus Bathyarchaeota archaeon]